MYRYLRRSILRIVKKAINPKRWFSPQLPFQKPQISCKTAFHGTEYGGWTLCPDEISSTSIVYSFGVGEDTSFDLEVIATYGAQVYTFDPTPRSIAWVNNREWPYQFHFFPIGIAAHDGYVDFNPPENLKFVSHTLLDRPRTDARSIQVEVQKLSSIANLLGHRKIDILKMDIEGAEYEVIFDIVKTDSIEIEQILVEFHHHFQNVSVEQTKNAIRRLNASGFLLFHVSKNGREYSFIKQGSLGTYGVI